MVARCYVLSAGKLRMADLEEAIATAKNRMNIV